MQSGRTSWPYSCDFSSCDLSTSFTFLAAKHTYIPNRGYQGMNFPQKKIIPVLVLILSSLSIIRLVKITITTTSPSLFSRLPPTLQRKCSSPSCISLDSTNLPKTSLLKKEYIHLFNLVASKVQCNLLIFGLEPEYIALSEINAGGTTIILEDDQEKLSTIRTNSSKSRIYKVKYQIPAKDAYKLLKHARKNPGCAPISELHLAKCRLALTTLPQEVYELKWDVVVVDGPRGDTPDSPGRMGAIYSAAVLARAGNGTDVAVHDVDRTIEKWFSWEFLCDKNLVSSRGKLWIFRIKDQQHATTFCSATMPE